MKISQIINIFSQMGIKYLVFRASFELLKRCGLMRILYPVNVPILLFISLKRWRKEARNFFINKPIPIAYTECDKFNLKCEFNKIIDGQIQFFTNEWISLGLDYNWLTNPLNNYKYDKNSHWSKINDFSTVSGDIKYVWEKSRFTYLFTIIRNDQANNEDNSSFIWKEIISWINNNNYNCGPNYKCSQEISIRILNWVFALYYYKENESLTEDNFATILNSIYWQTRHIDKNFLFSKISVRNNHAITEALCLFTIGLLFPWIPESKKWFRKGKASLEEEGLYQIYNDGSYIQHSFNYQRVVIQLYTWALSLGKVNNICFKETLIHRLKSCVSFLGHFTDCETGFVPNHGPNDSALFFPLNSCICRDFRPQLNALHAILFNESKYQNNNLKEDMYWFGLIIGNKQLSATKAMKCSESANIKSFHTGGYYILNGTDGYTFLRCAKYKHRPFHSDNLHIDIWYDHKNILRDSGTYKYNTDPDNVNFFCGTTGHNSLMIGNCDQMQKGRRFIWYNWSECTDVHVADELDYLIFKGTIKAFKHVRNNIFHIRTIKTFKNKALWIINDTITVPNGYQISQHWNTSDDFFEMGFKMQSFSNGVQLQPHYENSWYSEYYGSKRPAKKIIFQTFNNEFNTLIYHEKLQNTIDAYLP